MMKLTKDLCEQALMGGLLLGGGGGGTLTAGKEALEETFAHTKEITMLDASELKPDDIVANVSTLGAPSAKDIHLTSKHWLTAFQNFEFACGKKTAGFTSCENGAISTANGWILSALTGIPIIDAPSNGRAHPTGTMGSMGLNLLPDYVTIQSSCGGEGARYVETIARGALNPVSHIIRQSAVADGGMVGVVRNPVTAEYLRKNAAVGAIRQALAIGKIFRESGNGTEFVNRLVKEMHAEVLLKGIIEGYSLKMEGGYDIGSLSVTDGKRKIDYTFWNEYMAIEENGKRIATFPDLICTLDAETGEAVSSAEAGNGREVFALVVPKKELILGAGMHQKELFREVETLIHMDMTECNRELF